MDKEVVESVQDIIEGFAHMSFNHLIMRTGNNYLVFSLACQNDVN